jgi:hypothetical protein
MALNFIGGNQWERRHPCLLFRNRPAEGHLVSSGPKQAGMPALPADRFSLKDIWK